MRFDKYLLSGLAFVCSLNHSVIEASQWSAGPVAIAQASPYIGGESGLLFVPAISYEGEKLRVRGPFVDYFLYDEGRNGLSVALTLALGPNQLEVDNDPILDGIEDRDSGVLAGVRAQQAMFGGTAGLSIQTDVLNKSQGQRVSASWSRPFFSPNPRKAIFTAGIELTWESEDYANFYYGISQQESLNSIYDEYSIGAVVQPALTFGGYYNLNSNWQIIYNLEWQFLNSDVKNSPIVDQSSVASGVLGFVYNF